MQFIIDFIDNATNESIQEYLTNNGCAILTDYSSFEKCYLVSASTEPPVTEIVQYVIKDDANPIKLLSYPVANGETYPTLEISTVDDEDWWKIASYNRPDLNVPIQNYERHGSTATVYIVDSGVMSSHPDLLYADIVHLYSFNGDNDDYAGHGTALASVISGDKCGITSAKIKSVKIFQKGVPTLQSHIIKAFDTIINDVIANPNSLAIVNLSWSIPKNPFIEAKIRILVAAGVSVVAAAGNSGVPIDDVTPASMPEVMTVGSYSQNFEPCDFSNYTGDIKTTLGATNSNELDVWAPGEKIRIAILGGAIGQGGGTSISTAIQSAAIAYNSRSMVFEDGTVPTVISNTSLPAQMSIGRPGLLILNAPYENSVNKITTVMGEYDGQNNINYTTGSIFSIVAKSGELIEKLALPNFIVKTFTIADKLPEGFKMDNGWITGHMDVTDPFFWASTISYTRFNGTNRVAKLHIAILPDGKTVDDLGLDPEIKVTLLACVPTYGGGEYFCSGSCTGGGFCANACPGPAKSPNDTYCYCNPPQSDCP